MTTLLTIFQRYPTTFRRFPKIFPNLSEGHTNVSEHSPNIFRRLPKVAEEEPIMFRSYSKTSVYFLRDYVTKAMVIMLSSRVKIYMLFTGLGRSVWEITVPEVLSTARGRRPRAVIMTKGTVFSHTDQPSPVNSMFIFFLQ